MIWSGIVLYHLIVFIRTREALVAFAGVANLAVGAAVLMCSGRLAFLSGPAATGTVLAEPYVKILAALLVLHFAHRFLSWGRAPRWERVLVSGMIGLVALFGIAPFLAHSVFSRLSVGAVCVAAFGSVLILIRVAWRDVYYKQLYVGGYLALPVAIALRLSKSASAMETASARTYDLYGGVLIYLLFSSIGLGLHLSKTRTERGGPTGSSRPDASNVPARIAALQPDSLRERLTHLMEVDRLYCDEDLSLSRLAYELGIRPDQLSYVLNQLCGKNFAQYVNGYRIALARQLLLDEDSRSIAAIAQTVGFNSQQVFNAVFRKHTGMSPGKFRKQQKSADTKPDSS